MLHIESQPGVLVGRGMKVKRDRNWEFFWAFSATSLRLEEWAVTHPRWKRIETWNGEKLRPLLSGSRDVIVVSTLRFGGSILHSWPTIRGPCCSSIELRWKLTPRRGWGFSNHRTKDCCYSSRAKQIHLHHHHFSLIPAPSKYHTLSVPLVARM